MNTRCVNNYNTFIIRFPALFLQSHLGISSIHISWKKEPSKKLKKITKKKKHGKCFKKSYIPQNRLNIHHIHKSTTESKPIEKRKRMSSSEQLNPFLQSKSGDVPCWRNRDLLPLLLQKGKNRRMKAQNE